MVTEPFYHIFHFKYHDFHLISHYSFQKKEFLVTFVIFLSKNNHKFSLPPLFYIYYFHNILYEILKIKQYFVSYSQNKALFIICYIIQRFEQWKIIQSYIIQKKYPDMAQPKSLGTIFGIYLIQIWIAAIFLQPISQLKFLKTRNISTF